MALDPISLGMMGVGLTQGILGAVGRKKATREMESLVNNSPQYQGNGAITNFYNQAKERYSANPYNTAKYQAEIGAINRNLAATTGGVMSRRLGANTAAGIFNQAQYATADALGRAEADQMNRFAQLGNATNMLAADQMQQFEINEMQPWMQKLNLLNAKASGNSAIMNSGLSNIMGGAQSMLQDQMLDRVYGNADDIAAREAAKTQRLKMRLNARNK